MTSASSASKSTPTATSIDADREIRLAVVLYGGVSLAIYIHGVTQELLRAVKATSPENPDSQRPLLQTLTPTEEIYRELGCRAGSATPFAADLSPEMRACVRTRLVVDVLSGTSAGGINGIFLAKALANNQTLEELRLLWLREGDLDLLLNDGKSKLPGIPLESPPPALLNTRRLYYRLLNALDGLDHSNPMPPARSPLVDELDLFVTATDIRGLRLPLALWDRAIFERRYRNVFHMRYSSPDGAPPADNDFTPRENGFLAFAARSTSSFPLAFEPMRLEDIQASPPWRSQPHRFEQDASRWAKFFPQYMHAPELSAASKQSHDGIAARSFGDGGYLDNKPFSYAIDQIGLRRTGRRVSRKLIYVEPAPEHPELDHEPDARPDVIENLIAAGFSLPRSERVREDLERVIARNGIVGRVRRVVQDVDEDLRRKGAPPHLDGTVYASMGLKAMLELYGAGYVACHRIKVIQATSELASAFTRLSGLDETSGLTDAITWLVRVWRTRHFDREPMPAKQTENRFLLDFDWPYRERRLAFIQDRLDDLLGLIGREERRAASPRLPVGAPDRDAREEAAARAHERDLQTLRTLFAPIVPGIERWLEPQELATFRRVVLSFKRSIDGVQAVLQRELQAILQPSPRNQMGARIAGLGISVQELSWVLATPVQEEREVRAEQLLEQPPSRRGVVADVMTGLAEALHAVFTTVGKAFFEIVEPMPGTLDLGIDPNSTQSSMTLSMRRVLESFYQGFEVYDSALFPLSWGTGTGNTAAVDVVRISPDDTTLLEQFSRIDGSRQLYKLAGTRLANFGSFLDEAWRRSDMLWGRLDGVERIVSATLVASTPEEERIQQSLIRRAQAAIVCEELAGLGETQARRVLYQCCLRTVNGKPDPERLAQTFQKLLPDIRNVSSETAKLFENNFLQEAYVAAFDNERSIAPAIGVPLLARSSQILGRVLDGLSATYGPLSRRAGFGLLWTGRTLWGVVEVSLPRSLWSVFTRYWLNLAYVIGLVLTVVGMLMNHTVVRQIGEKVVLLAVVVDVLRAVLRSLLTQRLRFRTILLFVGIALAALGAWTVIRGLPTIIPFIERQTTTIQDWTGYKLSHRAAPRSANQRSIISQAPGAEVRTEPRAHFRHS